MGPRSEERGDCLRRLRVALARLVNGAAPEEREMPLVAEFVERREASRCAPRSAEMADPDS